MESIRGFEFGFSEKAKSVAPNLSRMKDEGLWFPNTYFNRSQTARGEFATLCSMRPYFEGGQEYTKFPNLPECPEGQKPEFKGHSCFALSTEIVDRPIPNFSPLDEVREKSLLERGALHHLRGHGPFGK